MDAQELVDKMSLLFEANRLSTFSSWVFDDEQPCNAAKMAEAGFYYTGSEGEPDSVECFLCEKPLDGWLAEDDPWVEHLKHSPNCTFAKLQQPENALTYYQFIDLKGDLMKRYVQKVRKNVEESFEKKEKELRKLLRSLK